MSKSFALAAFNTAVVATNAAHAAKRGVVAAACFTKDNAVAGAHAAKHGVVAAASFTKDNAVAGTTATKEAGIAFWAGMKYAHQYNKENAVAAERLTPEDIGASKPKTAKTTKTRMVAKARLAADSAK